MKEMLRLRRDMSQARATVDTDPFLSIIMQSDMAKAFPAIAIAMADKCHKNTEESIDGN
jgi:hypothetical protein